MLRPRSSTFLAPLCAFLLLPLAGRTLRDQTFNLEQNREQVAGLTGLSAFHPGDNPQWADPGFAPAEVLHA